MKYNVAQIAKTCHEANRVLCELGGDMSQPEWDNAPVWQRNSALVGVTAYLNDPNMTPEDTHKLWMKTKAEDGWVYGEVKDAEKKTHPCMVEYNRLPDIQKIKDLLFLTIVRSFIEK